MVSARVVFAAAAKRTFRGDDAARMFERDARRYEYLLAATAATRNVPGVAGVSLQRQASRLDAYPRPSGN